MSNAHPRRRWRENWVQWPHDDGALTGWAHHGLATTGAGELLVFHPGTSTLLFYASDGTLTRSVACPVREAHGITVVAHEGEEHLWIADAGFALMPQPGGSFRVDPPNPAGQVIRLTLAGTVVQRLATPPLPVYRTSAYLPTSVAVHESRHGGSGEIWVADGYGQSLIHRFAGDGTYRDSITGEEGTAGRFSCPHDIFLDYRRPEPELYIADRQNACVQVYDLDGGFRRSFGEDFLNSPSAFAPAGDNLVIAELFARLAVVGPDDRLIEYLGANPEARRRPGWPNALAPDGSTTRPPAYPGRFNSPHGLATDRDGTIHVCEWLIGGRLIRLDGELSP